MDEDGSGRIQSLEKVLLRKGIPSPAVDIFRNLDKPEPGEMSHLNFRVPKSFHRGFAIFAATEAVEAPGDVIDVTLHATEVWAVSPTLPLKVLTAEEGQLRFRL